MHQLPSAIGIEMSHIVQSAQESLCGALAEVDTTPFQREAWTAEGSDAVTYVDLILERGSVFESISINAAVTSGVLSPEAAAAASGSDDLDQAAGFFATGISMVVHPVSPFVPSVHANFRYFELSADLPGRPSWWFGGGADLSPAYLFEEDVEHFHGTFRHVCDGYDPSFYPRFKDQCDKYFYIPHRKEHRGVGGIFFEGLSDREPDALLEFVSQCIDGVSKAYLPIVHRRKALPYGARQRDWQLIRRGRYAEFNLMYDRGTAFGLKSGGRPESILMSLPPAAHWRRDVSLGEPEHRLLRVLRSPREWTGEVVP